MNNKLQNAVICSTGASSISWIATGLQTSETFQYLQLILSIIGSAITVIIGIYTLVLLIIKLVRKWKNNEPITSDDINKVTNKVESIVEGVNDVVEKITSAKEKKDGTNIQK